MKFESEKEEDDKLDKYSLTLFWLKAKLVLRDVLALVVAVLLLLLAGSTSCTDRRDEVVDAEDETELE